MNTEHSSPTRDLSGRLALITGASRGIGAATARRFASLGADVILAARSTGAIEELAAELTAGGTKAWAIATNMTDRASVRALMERVSADHGRLDILMNNAGVLPPAKRAEQTSYEEWDSAMELNLTTPWYLSCRAKELMADRGGVILNVASTASYFPSKGLVAYNVSKSALLMLTRVCALEWARAGVRVLGMAPGKVETDLVQPVLRYSESRKMDYNPQRRVADPSEAAELAAYLVSDAAKFMTGVVVPFDGGELLVAGAEAGR